MLSGAPTGPEYTLFYVLYPPSGEMYYSDEVGLLCNRFAKAIGPFEKSKTQEIESMTGDPQPENAIPDRGSASDSFQDASQVRKKDLKDDRKLELRRQLRINKAELGALDALSMRHQKTAVLLDFGLALLIVLEATVVASAWLYRVSLGAFTLLLLSISVLLAFFIILALRGVFLSTSLRRAVRRAQMEQMEAIEFAEKVLDDA
jgi:hypothetical protein